MLAVVVGGVGGAAACAALASCGVATPFRGTGWSASRGVTLPDAGPTVWVGVTNALLDGAKRGPFDRHTRLVLASLPDQEGYIGHSVRGRILGHEVWTMTVWRDADVLEAFIESAVHVEAIRQGLPAVRRAKFVRFEWPADRVPPAWADVLTRLDAATAIEYRTGRPAHAD